MTKKQTFDPSISQYIISAVETEKAETTKQLIEIVQQKYPLTENDITKIIMQLQSEGKIRLVKKEASTSLTPGKYVFSSKAAWYWTTIALTIAAALAVFTVPEDVYPIVYIRYVLGAIFVLWLPGYALIKALFPTQVPIKTPSESLDLIERIVLSACMNLALVPIIGLLLNYAPWGIRLTPITLSMLALTTLFATIALIREYQIKNKHSKP